MPMVARRNPVAAEAMGFEPVAHVGTFPRGCIRGTLR